MPLLLVLTYREALGADHPLGPVIGELVTLPDTRRLRLVPLSQAAVRQLCAGQDLDPEQVHHRTGGGSQLAASSQILVILTRLGPTLLLMLTVFVIAVTFGVVMSAIAARNLNRWRDGLISMLAVLAYATPVFWAGLMFIVIFSIHLGWFPTSGYEEVAAFKEGWAHVIDVAHHHLILPAITLTMFYLALYTRLMRASVLDQYTMDYVVTARAKGLSERQIARRHVLRNAALPVLTMAGVQVGALLGGAVVVETVFAWPGLGLLAYESLFARDINLLLGIFFISALLVVLVNLAVDLLYTLFDPRIELR